MFYFLMIKQNTHGLLEAEGIDFFWKRNWYQKELIPVQESIPYEVLNFHGAELSSILAVRYKFWTV